MIFKVCRMGFLLPRNCSFRITVLRRNIFSSPESGKKTDYKRGNKSTESSSNRFTIPPGGLLLLVIPVSTLCLGVWQVYRWKWKLGLIETMENKVRAEVSEFPYHQLEELDELEYQKVKIRGVFDYSNEVLMGPRSLLQSGDSLPKGLISRNSQSGYHVVTPFKLIDHNVTVLVNRGWIPGRQNTNFTSVTEPTEIIGVVRKTENRAPFMGKNIPQKKLWLSRDIPAMAEYLGTDEIFIDLHSIVGTHSDSDSNRMFPIPGQTRVTMRNEHVSYFCTWFSLSAITSYMWHRRFILLKPLL